MSFLSSLLTGRRGRRLLAAAAVGLLSVAPLAAELTTAVAFEGDMTTVNNLRLRNFSAPAVTADLDGDGATDDSFTQFVFSATQPLSPPISYTGPRFFGGFRGEVLNQTGLTFGERNLVNNGTTDAFGVRYQPATTNRGRLHIVAYFDKADFLGGASSAPVKFDHKSSLTIRNPRFDFVQEARWLVRDGTQFYVSEKRLTANGSLTFTNNLDDGRWAPFNPAASLNFDEASATFAPQDFQDITAIGLIVDGDEFVLGRIWFQFNKFEANVWAGEGEGTPNLAPTAGFTASRTTVKLPREIQFDAASSSDPEGDTLTYAWDFGDGSSATGSTASHSYTEVGTYVVTLVVTDSYGNVSVPATSSITVLPPNVVPVAIATAPVTAADVPATFVLDASGSYDPDGQLTRYAWSLSDGTTAEGAVVSLPLTVPGLYTATLMVTDDDDAIAMTSLTLKATVNGTLPPIAAFTSDLDTGYAPLTLDFDAGASIDLDGSIVSYDWNFGDGFSASGVGVTHTYKLPGSYTATLTVTDDRGVSGSTTKSFEVGEPIFTETTQGNVRLSSNYLVRQGPGVFTLKAGGVGLRDDAGQYFYLYQTLEGDGELTTRVAGFDAAAHAWASAGVMIRSTLDREAASIAATVTAGKGLHTYVRASDGASVTATQTSGSAPVYLKVGRVGDTFTASSSLDGQTWTVLASFEAVLPESVFIGLMAAGGQNGRTATVTLDQVVLPRRTGSPSGGPVDNPVATHYGSEAYPWTDEILWENVYNIIDFPGATDMERYIAARDAAVLAGGGVVYFPSGTYTFDDHLYLANGVVLRGEKPAVTDARNAAYEPPTKFVFPQYVPSFTGSGTPTSGAFKQIFTQDGNTDSNLGLVYIDVNRARINLQGDANSGTNRNYLVFGVRSNNVALPEGGVPVSYQHAWQRWSNRFATNVSISVFENALVGNNRINDAVTDSFQQPGYIVEDTSQPTGSAARFPALDGHQAVFSYTDHYGIYVNRGASVTHGTPETAPSLFRTGIVIRENWVYCTMRVKIHAAGQGLVIAGNVLRDDVNKAHWVDPTGRRLVSNAATLENRGIDWSGHDVKIVDNDVEVFRHRLKEGPYYSVDGEGILHQECCGGSSIRGLLIEDNIANAYIGLYKSRDIEDVVIRGNLVTAGPTSGFSDLIYVNADTNNAAFSVKNVVIENNTIESGNNIRLQGNGPGGGTGNVIRNNTSTGSGTIHLSNAANATVTGNTGFTVNAF